MTSLVKILRDSDWARCIVLATGQHKDMLDRMITRFGIHVDHNLDLMVPAQNLTYLIARAVPAISDVINKTSVNAVLAQGDTASVFSAALAAFLNNIPFGHVEAGLRTFDLNHPYPEEGFRQMIARITRWHFAPTQQSAKNLLAEGIASSSIHITGNTGIDTLLQAVSCMPSPISMDIDTKKLLLLTAHRRENFGEPLSSIFEAIKDIVTKYPTVEVVYPVHPNPNVRDTAIALLANQPRIHLVEPLDYFEFVDLMRRAYLIITDSGGVQEEAPALGKPVLVLRNVTERPEAVEAGVSKVIGTQRTIIVSEVARLIEDHIAYSNMATGSSPYGDGKACHRIAAILFEQLVAEQ